MKVLDDGHVFELRSLDKARGEADQLLVFVKREGPGYPGNVGSHGGTTTQEVLRALIERTGYVDNQIRSVHNDFVTAHLRAALWHLEARAAARHGREFDCLLEGIEVLSTCDKCNHIGCYGRCHP